jgi:RNase H-fold protein (predicted Holliday junction resolvase)
MLPAPIQQLLAQKSKDPAVIGLSSQMQQQQQQSQQQIQQLQQELQKVTMEGQQTKSQNYQLQTNVAQAKFEAQQAKAQAADKHAQAQAAIQVQMMESQDTRDHTQIDKAKLVLDAHKQQGDLEVAVMNALVNLFSKLGAQAQASVPAIEQDIPEVSKVVSQ